MATPIHITFHAVIKQRFSPSGHQSGRPSVRVSKGKPACDFDEVAVAISLQLPESLFKRPQLQARIVVPESAAPAAISPDIQDNIAQLVQDQLGIVLRIEAPRAEE